MGEEAGGEGAFRDGAWLKKCIDWGEGKEKFTLVDVKLFWVGRIIPCHLTTLYLQETIVGTK
jgi:hypothetical protein